MKRLFSLLMFCLLLLVSATAMAASYGAYPYMRYGANGRDNASLHLIYTQSGIFASVVTYDLQDGNAPMFKGVGMLENGSLVLEDYSFTSGNEMKKAYRVGYLAGETNAAIQPEPHLAGGGK